MEKLFGLLGNLCTQNVLSWYNPISARPTHEMMHTKSMLNKDDFIIFFKSKKECKLKIEHVNYKLLIILMKTNTGW